MVYSGGSFRGRTVAWCTISPGKNKKQKGGMWGCGFEGGGILKWGGCVAPSASSHSIVAAAHLLHLHLPPLPVLRARRRHQRGLLTLTRVGSRHLRSNAGGGGGAGGGAGGGMHGESLRIFTSYLCTHAFNLSAVNPPSLHLPPPLLHSGSL